MKKINPLILMAIVILIIIGIWYLLPGQEEALAPTNQLDSDSSLLATICHDEGGNWLADFNECEYVSEDWCLSVEGEFEECASSCRHIDDPDIVCIMKCVPVCHL